MFLIIKMFQAEKKNEEIHANLIQKGVNSRSNLDSNIWPVFDLSSVSPNLTGSVPSVHVSTAYCTLSSSCVG